MSERSAAGQLASALRNMWKAIFQWLYPRLLSEEVKHRSERTMVWLAIVSFVLHLGLILFYDLGLLGQGAAPGLLLNPIAAIYTPFSFILIYEVYLLVYYLPQSTTRYIGKQYEIITLIVIRRVFKDLSKLELTPDWFSVRSDLQFTYDLLATPLLFALIYVFYRLNRGRIEGAATSSLEQATARFIQLKQGIALLLVPLLLALAGYSFSRWLYADVFSLSQVVDSIRNVNTIFFEEFFTLLILTDVLLLLFSLLHTDRFSKVIRNSGYIISTILIKLSFGVEGLLNTVLILTAVLFGVLILAIHNRYERMEAEGSL